MEYPDVIDRTKVAHAVSLTRDLLSQRTEPLSVLVEEAVARTFCSCVTGGEDAAEGHFSAIHATLIETVVAEVSQSVDHLTEEDRA
jgi:hypothetical protein